MGKNKTTTSTDDDYPFKPCPTCGGTGSNGDKACGTCSGEGYIDK